MSSKSVSFAAPASSEKRPVSAKRSREVEEPKPGLGNSKKRYRRNKDEMDDINEWTNKEGGDEENGQSVPSESELLEAKRKRQQKRGQRMDEGGTHIDETTSLATEGIPIEPFHMQQEETDGTGYFEGDTYVFRKQTLGEEPDAWLDGLREESESRSQPSSFLMKPSPKVTRKPDRSMDDWTKEQLHRRVLLLVKATETVSQAVRRFGQPLKRRPGKKSGVQTPPETQAMAKQCLDDLAGAANALLLKGEVDVYDMTRRDILRLLPKEDGEVTLQVEQQTAASWEYMGNQDGQIHGPYTTEQMIEWTESGYFVGDQTVKIRTIRDEQLSTEDDLLADLVDDDNEQVGDSTKSAKHKNGEWMWSSEIDFRSFLPQAEKMS